jgi:hypothetical protein
MGGPGACRHIFDRVPASEQRSVGFHPLSLEVALCSESYEVVWGKSLQNILEQIRLPRSMRLKLTLIGLRLRNLCLNEGALVRMEY